MPRELASYVHHDQLAVLFFCWAEEQNVTLLLLGFASVALMGRLWRSSPVNRYACATLYLSTGSAAMGRDMSKALLGVQKWSRDHHASMPAFSTKHLHFF